MAIKTMSANEAKQNWGALMRAAREDDGIVVVESHGKPQVVVVSYDEYEAFRDFKEAQRRKELLRRLDAFEARWGGRNTDLTEEQIEELANRFSREFVDDLAAEGKITFADDDTQ
jgi:prevent-host-death family protein